MALLWETANAMRVRRKMMSDDVEFISAVQMDFRMEFFLNTEVKFGERHQIHGDQAAWPKPPVDIDVKIAF